MGRCLMPLSCAEVDLHNPIVGRALPDDEGLYHMLEVSTESAEKTGLCATLRLLAGGSGVGGDSMPL